MCPPLTSSSHNREDAAVAKLFAEAFAKEGLVVWWDATLRSGEPYDEVTEAALRGARAMVVLWSPRSVAFHWVSAEATIAYRSNPGHDRALRKARDVRANSDRGTLKLAWRCRRPA
jgi:hypothetical protein